MFLNAGALLSRRAQSDPEMLALISEGRSFTYKVLNEQSNKWANALLDLGVDKGDRVAALLQNCNEILELYFGSAKIGAIFATLNWRLAPPELKIMCDSISPKCLICGNEFVETVEGLRPSVHIEKYICIRQSQVPSWAVSIDTVARFPTKEPTLQGGGEDSQYIAFTSGTTGRPRGALYTHNDSYFRAAHVLSSLDIRKGDRVLVVGPLYTAVALLFAALVPTVKGCTTVLMKRFDPIRMLETIQREGVDVFHTIPTILRRLSLVPRFYEYLTNVRWILVGSAPVAPSLVQAYLQHGIRVGQAYGGTDFGLGSLLSPEDGDLKPGSAGMPTVPGEIRITDDEGRDVPRGQVGEILVKGFIMKEYWNNPEATEESIEDGWFRTGDLGRTDEDGYLYVVDRKKDTIISGGENIYPSDIEHVLNTHPRIEEVAVVGVPDEIWGEVVCAVILLKPGLELTVREVVDFCRGKLASFKIPRRVVFTDERLPVNPAGSKPDRRALRERVSSIRGS